MSDSIPFMDLAAQIQSLEPAFTDSFASLLKSQAFIHGPQLEAFNKNFLKLHGGKYGVGCSNGTSAITVALRALKIGAGDEVLVPNHTFFGTVEPIAEVGAVPVLVDLDAQTKMMDLKFARKKLTKKTKAIIPVHLYGLPEPMNDVMSFAKEFGLKVIEDCAQAHLSKVHGQPVGTFGDVATFSFYPGKNLGAFGDAGFIATQDANTFDFVKRYIDHGRAEKYVHNFFGGNFRMDGFQAGILNIKLTKMLEWTEKRRKLALAFDSVLKPKGFKVLEPHPESEPVYHLYVVEVSNRDQVMAHFKQKNIGCGIHYPVPLSLQPAFAQFGYEKGQFPVSERYAERILSLPFYPEMSSAQREKALSEFLAVAQP